MTPLNQKMYHATRISFTMSSHLWFIPLLSIQAININSFSDGCSLLFWLILRFKDVHAKNFYNTDFFILWLQSDNELPMSEMQKN